MSDRSRSMGPSLMELVFAIIIFALASAVCLRIFAGAKQLGRESAELTNAVFAAQTAAESYIFCEGDMSETSKMLSAQESENGFLQYFDRDWKTVDKSTAIYVLRGQSQAGGYANRCQIGVFAATEDDKALFQITAAAGRAES